MAIKVADNTKIIEAHIKEVVSLIENNANNGISETDIYVPKHIASEVREGIEKVFDGDGTKYDWMVVRRGTNPFTGRAEYFTGETIGDERHYKLKILN